MQIRHVLLAATVAAACGPAAAVTFVGSSTQGATVATDYSDAGLVSFDIDFANGAPVTLDYTITEADLEGTIAFEAVLRNFSGSGFGGYALVLDKGSFGSAGSVTRQFGGGSSVLLAGGTARISFTSPEFLDVELGNVLGTPGATDWTLASAGFQAGDRFGLTVSAVPEPGPAALLLAGLATLALLQHRHRG